MTATTARGGPAARWRPAMWAAIALLLLLPAAAMALRAPGLDWTATDFLFAALLLGGAGVVVELVMRFVRRPITRALLVGAALLIVMLVWAQGAVGVV